MALVAKRVVDDPQGPAGGGLPAGRVQAVVAADDGARLEPVNMTPQVLLARDWAAFKYGGGKFALRSYGLGSRAHTPVTRHPPYSPMPA